MVTRFHLLDQLPRISCFYPKKTKEKNAAKTKSRHYITDKVHSGKLPDAMANVISKNTIPHKPERKRNHRPGNTCRLGQECPFVSFGIRWSSNISYGRFRLYLYLTTVTIINPSSAHISYVGIKDAFSALK